MIFGRDKALLKIIGLSYTWRLNSRQITDNVIMGTTARRGQTFLPFMVKTYFILFFNTNVKYDVLKSLL